LASYTLAFAVQPRKRHGKPSDVDDYQTENFRKELFGNELGFKKDSSKEVIKEMVENGRSPFQIFCKEGVL
jgi:hypothetical protein